MWDGGWDDAPIAARPGQSVPAARLGEPDLTAGTPGATAQSTTNAQSSATGQSGARPTSTDLSAAGGGSGDGAGAAGWLEKDGSAPGRWYAPGTQRGKVTLLLVVIAVLAVTLVGCLAAVGGLRELKAMDLFDLI